MTLLLSTLQIRIYEYSGDSNIVLLFVSICIIMCYAINMDVVSLFANAFFLFLFLATLNSYYVDVLYQFE